MEEATITVAQEAARNVVQLAVILELKDAQAGYYLGRGDDWNWHMTTEHVPDLRYSYDNAQVTLLLACGNDPALAETYLNDARYLLEKEILHLP